MNVIRDGTESYIECPDCAAHIPVTIPGQDWTANAPYAVAHRLMATLGHEERECLDVLLLNTKNRVLRVHRVYAGNLSATLVRISELFIEAVRDNAAGVILVHNHPSGDPTPSPDDLHLTAQAIAAGRLLDMPVLDHLVITRDQWVSLRDRGIAFDNTGVKHPGPAAH